MSDKYEMRTLINELNRLTVLYDAGTPSISDEEWDKMYFELQKKEKETGIIYPDSPTQKIHFETVSQLNKVTHSSPMLSLDKTKDPNEVYNFLKGHNWFGMFKMDGLTARLTYLNGKLAKAETRGNGEEGEDITHSIVAINSVPLVIPTNEPIIEIDGEIICTYEDFKPFANEYKNPRNFASGSIRQLNAAETALRNLTFVAWEFVTGEEDIDFNFWRLEKLDDWGFTTVPRVGDTETVNDTIKYLDELKAEGIYPIDGYVFKFESRSYGKELGRTDHHWRNAIALKFYDEEYETNLQDIEWSMGRTGVLTPVAIFDPIEIDGTIVERASLHNFSVMTDIIGTHPYKGQKIKVVKMNMIIPQLTWADKNEENINWDNLIKLTSCPICGGSLEIKDNNGVITVWCENPSCEGKLINRINHYCGKKGLDIKGLSIKTIEKLIDWGWINELGDIYKLSKHRTEWIAKAGFGTASVGKILDAINQTGRHPKLYAFISGLGIQLVGRTVAREITKYYDTWEDFRNAVGGDWTEFEGFGPEISKSINDFDYTEADKIVAEELTFEQPEVQNNVSTPAAAIKDKVFCTTGKLISGQFKNRDELKADIEANGGKMVSSISSKVDYLITNTPDSGTAKNKKAQELGIKIITEEDYINMK